MVVDTVYPPNPELPGIQIVTMISRVQPIAGTAIVDAKITAIDEE